MPDNGDYYTSSSTSSPAGSDHFWKFNRWRDQMRILADYCQGNSVELEVPHAR